MRDMDFSVLGFKAEAIAIPVLYVETVAKPFTGQLRTQSYWHVHYTGKA